MFQVESDKKTNLNYGSILYIKSNVQILKSPITTQLGIQDSK